MNVYYALVSVMDNVSANVTSVILMNSNDKK